MYLPRRLREASGLDDFDEDNGENVESFRVLLLDVLAKDPDIQAVIRRLTAPAKVPEPRASRRR